MVDVLADIGPVLQAAAVDSPLLFGAPTVDELIDRLHTTGLDGDS